jgi:hypothetical protein
LLADLRHIKDVQYPAEYANECQISMQNDNGRYCCSQLDFVKEGLNKAPPCWVYPTDRCLEGQDEIAYRMR